MSESEKSNIFGFGFHSFDNQKPRIVLFISRNKIFSSENIYIVVFIIEDELRE